MNDFSRLYEKELGYINLFDRYFVLANALDINLEYNRFDNIEYDDDTIETLTSIEFITSIMDLFY